MDSKRKETKARELCLQFLYQCEVLDIFYFSLPHFENFKKIHAQPENINIIAKSLLEGIFLKRKEIDQKLDGVSINWSLKRMSRIDRSILRLSVYEHLENKAPKKVIINEAIELAKFFGTEHSSKFINGILNKIMQDD